jgi:hypothetical protein
MLPMPLILVTLSYFVYDEYNCISAANRKSYEFVRPYLVSWKDVIALRWNSGQAIIRDL